MSLTKAIETLAAMRHKIASMEASQSVQTVQAIYEAFGKRDAAKIFSLFAPDIVIVQPEELPWGGVYRGHAGAQAFFGKLLEHLSSTLEIERFIDSGDHVSVIGWTKGTVNGSGAPYRVPIVHTWKISGGLAVRAHFLIDNPTMLAALKVAKP